MTLSDKLFFCESEFKLLVTSLDSTLYVAIESNFSEYLESVFIENAELIGTLDQINKKLTKSYSLTEFEVFVAELKLLVNGPFVSTSRPDKTTIKLGSENIFISIGEFSDLDKAEDLLGVHAVDWEELGGIYLS
jgi:hypothetical protein